MTSLLYLQSSDYASSCSDDESPLSSLDSRVGLSRRPSSKSLADDPAPEAHLMDMMKGGYGRVVPVRIIRFDDDFLDHDDDYRRHRHHHREGEDGSHSSCPFSLEHEDFTPDVFGNHISTTIDPTHSPISVEPLMVEIEHRTMLDATFQCNIELTNLKDELNRIEDESKRRTKKKLHSLEKETERRRDDLTCSLEERRNHVKRQIIELESRHEAEEAFGQSLLDEYRHHIEEEKRKQLEIERKKKEEEEEIARAKRLEAMKRAEEEERLAQEAKEAEQKKNIAATTTAVTGDAITEKLIDDDGENSLIGTWNANTSSKSKRHHLSYEEKVEKPLKNDKTKKAIIRRIRKVYNTLSSNVSIMKQLKSFLETLLDISSNPAYTALAYYNVAKFFLKRQMLVLRNGSVDPNKEIFPSAFITAAVGSRLPSLYKEVIRSMQFDYDICGSDGTPREKVGLIFITMNAALLQTDLKHAGLPIANAYGISEGWRWLSRWLRKPPTSYYHFAATRHFLWVAGYAMFVKYGRQFEKMMRFIIEQWIEGNAAKVMEAAKDEKESSEISREIKELCNWIREMKYRDPPAGMYFYQYPED